MGERGMAGSWAPLRTVVGQDGVGQDGVHRHGHETYLRRAGGTGGARLGDSCVISASEDIFVGRGY